MIKVTNMKHGWLTLHINNKSFRVSYLTNFKREMDEVLRISYGEHEVNRVLFEGEGLDLYLTSWRVYDKLFIVWELMNDDPKPEVMVFDYEKFIEDYQIMLDEIEDNYRKDFLMEEE